MLFPLIIMITWRFPHLAMFSTLQAACALAKGKKPAWCAAFCYQTGEWPRHGCTSLCLGCFYLRALIQQCLQEHCFPFSALIQERMADVKAVCITVQCWHWWKCVDYTSGDICLLNTDKLSYLFRFLVFIWHYKFKTFWGVDVHKEGKQKIMVKREKEEGLQYNLLV